MPKVEFQDTDELPVCPHCEKELSTIHMLAKGIFFERQKVYMCPNCRKILGVAFDRS